MQALGFVRDAAEVGRVWGSFRRPTFRREGGAVFGFDTETSTGRSCRRTSTPTRELDLAVSDRRDAVGLRGIEILQALFIGFFVTGFAHYVCTVLVLLG